MRGNEPLDAEWGNRRIDRRVQYEPRDRIGSHRREQDAVAVMAGCKDEAIERPRTKDIDTELLVDLRRLLRNAGYGPQENQGPS